MEYSHGKRKLDNLKPDESLYDYMRSLQEFNLRSSYDCFNDYMLSESADDDDSSLIKNISFQDAESKQEILYDLILNTVLPETWWGGVLIRPESNVNECDGVEAILIDIKGSFSTEKFKTKLSRFYENTIKKIINRHRASAQSSFSEN